MSDRQPWAMRTKSPWSEKQQLHRERRQELWAWMDRERGDGEAMWDTARRILIKLALESFPYQKDAAEALGCSARVLSYYKKQWEKEARVECRLRKVK